MIDKTTRVVNLSKPLMVQYPVPKTESQEIVLRRDCVEFIAKLEDKFGAAIEQLLTKRVTVQEKLNLGHKLEFLDETKDIREQSWVINSIPKDLQKRHVEITGPVERKTIINALNSGADVFMADFEDSNSPTWNNIISGQVNLYDAIRREITFYNHAKNKTYKL